MITALAIVLTVIGGAAALVLLWGIIQWIRDGKKANDLLLRLDKTPSSSGPLSVEQEQEVRRTLDELSGPLLARNRALGSKAQEVLSRLRRSRRRP